MPRNTVVTGSTKPVPGRWPSTRQPAAAWSPFSSRGWINGRNLTAEEAPSQDELFLDHHENLRGEDYYH